MLQKEEPGRHLKTSAETCKAMKKQKITVKFCRSQFYQTAVECNMSLKLHSPLDFFFFFLKTRELFLMNMAKISIMTFLKWKRDTVVKESK